MVLGHLHFNKYKLSKEKNVSSKNKNNKNKCINNKRDASEKQTKKIKTLVHKITLLSIFNIS
jgi:hypothetical protein